MTQEEFAQKVAAALDKGVKKDDIARTMEVSRSTVDRWARGVSCPLPRVRQLVLREIEELETKL